MGGDGHPRAGGGHRAFVGVGEGVGDGQPFAEEGRLDVHRQVHVRLPVQVRVQRLIGGEQAGQVVLQEADRQTDGLGGEAHLQVGVGELALVGAAAGAERGPVEALGEAEVPIQEVHRHRVDVPTAVERVLVGRGCPDAQGLLLRSQRHQPQGGGGRVGDP